VVSYPNRLIKVFPLITLGYPHEPPLLGVRNPRGLEDSAVAGLLANMNSRYVFEVGTAVPAFRISGRTKLIVVQR
jgi:hypothetical protein